jgi:glutamate dehydrogenase
LERHSLRREIIALGLTNAIVNRGGPAMAARLVEETQRSSGDVAHAFLAAREVFELPVLWQRIDALDGKAKGAAQLALYQVIQSLVNAQTLWFVRNGSAISDLNGTIARHRAGLAALKGAIGSVLTPRRQALLAAEAARLCGAGIPDQLGLDVAALELLGFAPSITEIAKEAKAPVAAAAQIYLAIGEHLHISELASKAAGIATPDYYDRLAVAQALNKLAAAQVAFTRSAIGSAHGDVEAWVALQGDRFARVRTMLAQIAGEGPLTVARLLVAAGQLSDLIDVRPAAPAA